MKQITALMGVVIILMAALILDLTRQIRNLNERGVEIERDTVVRVDTIRVTEIVERWHRVVDYMEVPVTDTVVRNDTVYLNLPREQKMYEDSTFRAYVSGYRPALDSIWVYSPEREITVVREVTRKKDARFGVGLQGGYGVSKDGLTPYVGIGLSFNLLTF